ncbi:MAG TPA: Rid family detoxifying hydrolase [Chloroflexota bacterium]|nr:Rid family detoxifying hydrolase [Chloroflexota bacterium]
MAHEIVTSPNFPAAAGPYSHVVRWDRLVFTAGQVGRDAKTGQAAEGGVREQTRQVLINLRTVLEAAGTDLAHVLKTTCFLTDINDFAAFNEVYREFFPSNPPARSTVQAGLVGSYVVEVEAIAVLPD